MAGHDIVIHAAAMKFIPQGEYEPNAMYDINVIGSRNVAQAAYENDVKKVVGISTDKACYPINAYGCTKLMMERMFFEYSAKVDTTKYYLVRYGNVFGSRGSFIYNWKKSVEEEGKIYSTVPHITRFWFSDEDAAKLVIFTLESFHGCIKVPLLPSLSLEKIGEYLFPDSPIEYKGWRVGGEKLTECLLSLEEAPYAKRYTHVLMRDYADLWPPTRQPFEHPEVPYYSDAPLHEVTKEELLKWVKWDD
jgi:UDP-N-acetylglucosamine 4,6-dehydratase